MNNLTELEMETLRKVGWKVEEVQKYSRKHMDSLQDFIYNQFKIETDEPEVLKVCTEYIELSTKRLEEIESDLGLLLRHFSGQ